MAINYKKLKSQISYNREHKEWVFKATPEQSDRGIESFRCTCKKTLMNTLIFLIHNWREYREFTLYNKPHYTSKLARNYYKHINTGRPSKYFRP